MVRMEYIYSLSRRVYSEPTSPELKPYLLEYIQYYIDQARSVTDEELTHGKVGSDVSSSICGALAWQGANGVEGEDWVTEGSEPLLWAILNASCTLDASTDNLPVWRELLSLTEKL